ncbi:MAG: endonuclease/exonuclease/phosphatase family protein, partial [Proteobacteria bacterium]|nr:endonuclease/exonuclease/phosphatase family protein [Pseudomonadota bacterium]
MKRWGLAACVALVVVGTRCRRDPDEPAPPARFATFNIEDFPRSTRQIDGAFAELIATGASVIALQEIIDPQRFDRELRARLGATWELAFVDTRPIGEVIGEVIDEVIAAADHPSHHLAVAFDRRAWTLVGTTTHDDTRLVEGRWKPVFEVRLRPRAGGAVVAVLDVHLKAGGDSRSIRARQYAALATVLQRVQRTTPRVVLLGDFNATDDRADRADLDALARASGLAWAS